MKIESYLQFFKETEYCVVGAVDLVTPFNTLFLPTLTTLHLGNSREIWSFNCFLFLNPVKCFTTINNQEIQSLNNLPFFNSQQVGSETVSHGKGSNTLHKRLSNQTETPSADIFNLNVERMLK